MHTQDGFQRGVLDKLRQGKYSLDASLNLIRKPVSVCRDSLFQFMLQAEHDHLRNLLIIHGKGRDEASHANIIRSYLARWLSQFESVQAFCVAQPVHGGHGLLCRIKKVSAVASRKLGTACETQPIKCGNSIAPAFRATPQKSNR